jgi:amidase
MARTVADAVILLGAMVGFDASDEITREGARKAAKDYTKFLDPNGLKGARLGLVTQFAPQQNREAYNAFYKPFIDKLRDAGATLVDVTFPTAQVANDRTNVLLYEFKTDLNKYLAGRGSKYKTLEDLIKFNEENKEKELPKFGQELFIQSQAKGPLTDKEYLDSLAKIRKASREDGIDALVVQNRLDALVGPTAGAFWSMPAVAGYPSITVPVGLRDNAPAGMFFCGQPFTEPQLIKYAYAFEQLTKARVVPQFIPKRPVPPPTPTPTPTPGV